MKKTVLVIFVCLSSVYAGAQSTCETRVDAHPKATTRQRVNYCLTPDPVPPAPRAGENLVFSGVTTRPVAQTQPTPVSPSARKGSFDAQQVAVVQNLVPTSSFPKLTNEQLSEQEKLARQKELEEERAKIEAALVKADIKPQEHAMQEEVALQTIETSSGLKARHKKPSRRLMQKPQIIQEGQQTLGVTEEPLEEVAPTAPDYAYDDQSALPPEVSDYTPYTPAEQTPASAYEPYAPVSETADSYAPLSGVSQAPVAAASYTPAN